MNKKTVRDVATAGKRVLVRVDFNVPLADGAVADDTRVRAALPTIQYLVAQGARVLLMSHLGRPKGKASDGLRLKPVGDRLAELLEQPVRTLEQCVGPQVAAAAADLGEGEVLLLENLRFDPGERANDPKFAEALASLADLYVNDAFGTAHRAHASTAGIASCLPAVAGFLMEKELQFLGQALDAAPHPYVAILGGAKISDKIGVIQSFLHRADTLLIGGGMANTFLKAQGHPIGDSLVEEDSVEVAKELLAQASERLLLPSDLIVADAFAADANRKVVQKDAVPEGWRILDIGPETIRRFGTAIEEAQTVVWNGPMGVFEFPAFAEGTFAVARFVAAVDGLTIIGGGDSVAAMNQAGVSDQISHISTGGGASLEFLEGKCLPGVAALEDRA